MTRGIIYVTTTVVPGLVKIGKTGLDNFEKRMYILEHNGYNNVAGLKREYAIEVDDYDEKEQLLHTIFSKSRVGDSELFATDVNLVVQLLSSLEGTQVYPKKTAKEQVFDRASEEVSAESTEHASIVPDGTYTITRTVKRDGITAQCNMRVRAGLFTVLAGGQAAITNASSGLKGAVKALRDDYVDEQGKVTDNVNFTSPSSAAAFVIGGSCDGWTAWKTPNGKAIDEFRRAGEENA